MVDKPKSTTGKKKYSRNKKLTSDEKLQIQELWKNGGEITEISKKVKRHFHTVSKYLKDFCSTYGPKILEELEQEKKKAKESDGEKIYEDTLARLLKNGFTEQEARFRLERVINSLDAPKSSVELYNACVVSNNAKDMMVTKSDGGRDVAIMTGAASERLDDLRKKAKTIPKNTSHIFSSKGG